MTAWMPEALRLRAGALASPASAFVAREIAHAAPSFELDGTGLRALVRRVVEFAFESDVDEETDRSFVEGAGALLGLLLIAHTPQGAYRGRAMVHLVQLSEHGFFDPFLAVDQALSAPNVRTELLRHVREAEAEARGEGPLSRVVSALRTELASQRPELGIRAQFLAEVTLHAEHGDAIALDLTQTVAATRDAPLRSVVHSVQKLIAMLPGARLGPDARLGTDALKDVSSQLFPRMTQRNALDELSQRVGAALFSVPVAGDVVAALVVEQHGRARYVRAAEVAAWGLGADDALALAKQNLARASEKSRVLREDTADGPIYMVRSGDGRDSARVLLPELRSPIEERVGPYAVVTLPHRDVLFACDGRVEPLVRRLRERSEADAQRAPHRVSSALYVLREHGLTLLDVDDTVRPA